MRNWDAFYSFIAPDVPGCPDPMINLALIQSAREFCLRTGAWLEQADMFVAPGGVQRFEFDLGSRTELVAAKRATVNGVDIKVLGSDCLPADYEQPGTQFRHAALIQINPTEYMLYPMPSAGSEIVIQMVLRPMLGSTGVADVLFDKHAESISKGALYRLHASPGKPYSDLKAAALARTIFETDMNLAANGRFCQSTPAERKVKKASL